MSTYTRTRQYDGGNGIDFVKLFSHTGEYIKTIYPFPADKIREIKGLKWNNLPDSNGQFPVKTNFLQTSFLETGTNFAMAGRESTNYGWSHYGMFGKSATFLASANNKVAFGMSYMARLGLDGSSAGMDFMGPAVGFPYTTKAGKFLGQPNSASMKPDGKKIYFTGFHYCNYGKASADIVTSGDWYTHHLVYEMDLASNETPKIFMGDPLKAGNDEKSFNMPVCVFVDDGNRIYVCDYLNNRVQIFDENKKLLKSININYPAFVTVLPKSKEVIVISHLMPNRDFNAKPPAQQPITLYNLGKFENMAVGKSTLFPTTYVARANFGNTGGSYLYSGSAFGLGFAVTDKSGELMVWVSQEKTDENVLTRGKVAQTNIKIWKITNDKFELVRDFEEEAKKEMIDTKPVYFSRARLQVNPITGDLYSTKTIFGFFGKSFKELFKINPNTGKISVVELTFDAEDYCFDNNGFLYLKSQDIIARYNGETLKEIPWDYGIETKTNTSTLSDRKEGEVISGLKVPTVVEWHQGGIFVNTKGNILVSGQYQPKEDGQKKWVAEMYPGRPALSRLNNLVHIYDKFGKLVKSDVVPGLKDNYGVGLDQYNNIYVMNGSTRMLDGKLYPNAWTGTIMKFPFSGAKLLTKSDAPVPLPVTSEPKRNFDVDGLWVEGSLWYYGGVGFMGKNSSKGLAAGTGCACWNSRMAFDYLNRTYAPELERYSVAILDSNGNLITRVGHYGNRDSMGAKSLKPVGGDEVTMMHGAYLTAHTDKFLYIADITNDRIISVKMNYAVNELVGFLEK